MAEKIFKTTDIYLAATLLAVSFPIRKTSNVDGKVTFFFGYEREPMIGGDNWTIDYAVKAYWDKTLEISPLILFNAFKELKNRIYNQ